MPTHPPWPASIWLSHLFWKISLSDACDGTPDAKVPHFACQPITAHIEPVVATSLKFPDANYIIMPLFYWRTPGWFGRHLTGMLTSLASEVARAQSAHIGCILPFVVWPTMLQLDGSNLNAAAGDQFLRHLDAKYWECLCSSIPLSEVEAEVTLECLSALVTANT